ncbi:hypothetical protein DPMN_015244 [Dreissena polymorpha]|uniref:Uncharacterized protein n=1 Tax=Dreissena polymorpha TaxID=45954 RepID=A0A9D4N8T4_DREPO|nr:hypothetical protein DPMN_015244 [Dreissena polymorpha]
MDELCSFVNRKTAVQAQEMRRKKLRRRSLEGRCGRRNRSAERRRNIPKLWYVLRT